MVMVGATRTSWSIRQVSQEQFSGTHLCGSHRCTGCCCTLHDVEGKTPIALRTDSKCRQKKTLCFGEGTAKMFWHSTTIPAQPKCATCLCSHSHHRASLCLGAGGLASVSWCSCANARLAQLAARHAVQPRKLYFGYCSTNSDLEALLAHPIRGSGLSSRGTLLCQALPFQPLHNWQ